MILLAGAVPGVAVVPTACGHPAPSPPAAAPTPTTTTVTALPPSTTTAPPPPHSQLVRVTFPAGSTVRYEPVTDAFGGVTEYIEIWTVPPEIADEIADLRTQLPIRAPYGGLPWCAEDRIYGGVYEPEGNIQWSWGSEHDFLVVLVTPHLVKGEGPGTDVLGKVRGPGSEVHISRGPDNLGCRTP